MIVGPRVTPAWFALASAAPMHAVLFLMAGVMTARMRQWHMLRITLAIAGVWLALGADATLGARSFAVAPSAGSITVVSANLMAGNTQVERFADQLLAQDPDVIVTIETTTDTIAALDHAFVGFTRASTSTAARWVDEDYVVIWTRLKFTERPVLVIADRELPVVDVATENGPVRIVGVHLSSPTTPEYVLRVEREFNELSHADIGDTPTVLIGDFNTSVWSPALRGLRIDGRRFHSAERIRGALFAPTWPALSTDRTFGLAVPVLDLDHGMIAGLGVSAFGRFAVAGSDHVGIRFELSSVR